MRGIMKLSGALALALCLFAGKADAADVTLSLSDLDGWTQLSSTNPLGGNDATTTISKAGITGNPFTDFTTDWPFDANTPGAGSADVGETVARDWTGYDNLILSVRRGRIGRRCDH